MANRNFPSSRMYGQHMMPVRLDLSFNIGSSGAVSGFQGKGVTGVTRLSAGIYQIQLQDNYYSFLMADAIMEAPVTGSAIAGGSFVATTVYQIVTLGTTTQAQWVTAGVPSGITAAPGVVFKAAGIGAGTGTVKALGAAGIDIEIIGNPQLMLNKQPFQALSGGYITIQCVGPTSSSVTTPIAVDPPSGSSMFVEIWLNNSSVQ